MSEMIVKLKEELASMIGAANDLKALDDVRVSALGKKGRITGLMKTLGGMDPEERKTTGQALNALKNEIVELIKSQESALKKQEMDQRLTTETRDITLSTRPKTQGHIHPISQTIEEMICIFANMGFEVAEGPDIEDEYYDFTALNFPIGHPAREEHDTFYLPNDLDEEGERARKLLRTHTSAIQIRAMEERGVPLRTMYMGRCYRADHDMTHTPMFHQFEILMVDKKTNMGHLKGCFMDFVREFFEIDDLPVRFRPSFFPFVEPGAEMDIGCSREGGGLKIGGGADWLEIGGCGMVHPNVLKNCGIDPDEYQGFAAGMGVDRLAMLKYGIPDLRTFFESDTRWLKHYGFNPLQRPNRATNS